MLRKSLSVALCSVLLIGAPLSLSAQSSAVTPVAAEQGSAAILPDLAAFDAFIEQTRKQFDVPGVAVAIVKDGRIVLAKGYGVRELGKPDAVNAQTQFAIASNTKAFTAAALAMLADEGKLSFDDRVIDHLPWFRMSDPYVTREMRIKDLLSHRSGLSLGAGDLLYWPTTTYTTQEVAQRLKDVPLSGGFRERYAYDNILFGVAGLVVEQVSGQSFKSFLEQRFFKPLEMNSTVFNSDDLRPGMNTAVGHAKSDWTRLEPVKVMSWHNVSGAGGIYSSVLDLSQWMVAQLRKGQYGSGDQRLFSAKQQQAMWSMLTPINVGTPSVPELLPTKPNFLGYGMGWQLSDYRGQRMVWHTGGWPGQVSRVTLVPDQDLGIVVLTNAEVGAAFNAVTYRALDLMLGTGSTDWNAAYGKAVAKAQANADESWAKHVAKRNVKLKPSLPLSRYEGTYADPWYGDVRLFRDNGKLRIQFSKTPDLLGTLEPWQGDTFIARWDQRWLNGDAFLTFNLDADGQITLATMAAVSPLTDFSFDFQDLRLKPVAADNATAK